ncbi:MAG: S8 family serine peptidase [Armatimonadota bacterium]
MPRTTASLAAIGLLLLVGGTAWPQRPDRRVVPRLPASDANANRVHDRAEAAAVALSRQPGTLQELIVCFDHAPRAIDAQRIRNRGGTVHQVWSSLLYAVHCRLPPAAVPAYVASRPDVVWVEPVFPCHADLAYASRQSRARDVWNGVINSTNYLGDGSHAIAILDTGLDDSHPDFGSRIVAWTDTSGLGYANPIDIDQHGTAVAGMAAGSGAQAGTADFSFSLAERVPRQVNFGYLHRFHLSVGATPQTITGRLLFESTGREHFLELRDDGSSTIGSGSSSTQGFTVTSSAVSNVESFTYEFFFGKAQGGPTRSAASQLDVPYDSLDSRNLLQGMAPNCDLVGVKVLDDTGSGTTMTILNGLTWVDTNRKTYGITVANASLSFAGVIVPSVDTAVNNLVDHGVVFCGSAGNGQDDSPPTTAGSPGSATKAISVAATNENDAITAYSSLGEPGTPVKPDIAAPGGSLVTHARIYTVDSNDSDGALSGWRATDRYADDYAQFAGTSASCPMVSGLAALVADALDVTWDHDSNAHSLLVKNLICLSASEVQAGEDAVPTLERDTSIEVGAPPGKDRVEGYGRANFDAAVEAAALSIAPSTRNIGGWNSFTFTFGDGPLDRKVSIRPVSLVADVGYNVVLEVPSGADFDLYLYEADLTDGNPNLLDSSTDTGLGDDEFIGFKPASNTQGYIVARWVSGSGLGEVSVGQASPTVLRVAELQASAAGPQIALKWRTTVEADVAGFRLEASPTRKGTYRPLIPGLMAAKGRAVGGGSYEFRAPRQASPRWYRLVIVHDDGREEPSEPVLVR